MKVLQIIVYKHFFNICVIKYLKAVSYVILIRGFSAWTEMVSFSPNRSVGTF